MKNKKIFRDCRVHEPFDNEQGRREYDRQIRSLSDKWSLLMLLKGGKSGKSQRAAKVLRQCLIIEQRLK